MNLNPAFTPTWLASCAAAIALLAVAPLPASALTDAEAIAVQRTLTPDRSGQVRKGKASYYHHSFAGRKMADGGRMDPESNNAASKTLPLGTVAKVTNLENGRSAIVKIRDRGPYADGRIVDLSPGTARELDMTEKGVVRVVVAPLIVPQPDGSIKLGAGLTEGGQATASVR